MALWKRRLVDDLRTRIADVSARADALDALRRGERDRVVREAVEAISEGERKLRTLAEVHERARATLDKRRRNTLHAQAAEVHREASRHARGPAAQPWPVWRPATDACQATGPLIRVGSTAGETPALVELTDRSHLSIDSGAVGALPGILLRAMGSVKPGDLRVHLYDPESLGQTLAAFAPLARAGLLTFIGPSGLRDTLDTLVEHVRRVNADVLAGQYGSLAEVAARNGATPEPRHLLVLHKARLGDWHDQDTDQLARLRRTGTAAGVTILTVGDDLEGAPRLTTTSYSALPGCAIELDPPPPARLITTGAAAIADAHHRSANDLTLTDLLPEEYGTGDSASGLTVPIGRGRDGRPVDLTLGDNPPHALVGGPSGTGKTNLLYAWIAALTTKYRPKDLELYLLDFKEGVSFARYAAGKRDRTWLPNARLVGININDDREFGLAMLRHLKDELRQRAEAAKRHEAVKLSELRRADPDNDWPRIVAVIDEFQVLLENRDSVTEEAVALLDDLARRGRSQGIHLILASQDVAGIEALWGRPSLVAQFSLRIALPKARRLLADNNHAADTIPRHHAVVNAESGQAEANQITALPDAGGAETWRPIQQALWERDSGRGPVLFDGEDIPALPRRDDDQSIPIGQTIDVEGRPAVFRLSRSPGRNLAVIGTRTAEAHDVLASAALRLRGTAVALCSCDSGSDAHAMALAAALEARGTEVHWYDGLEELTEDWPRRDGPVLNLVYAVDAGTARMDAAARAELRAMLVDGPENRCHTVGWWRGVPRLRDDLGGYSARFDAVDGWVALDCHGSELAPLTPSNNGPTWYPRTRRALYFDRAHHRVPGVVIPYDTAPDLDIGPPAFLGGPLTDPVRDSPVLEGAADAQ
ncbi:FtsK/SpoIIIE domain-containing protein [Salininema proteolyticum]|uniref:FtsK/SpoIIIE domain-containing protein n=1 Tax=Salininema proteolyticum TaxID=1607685 RepID=A0ABV8TYK6_9ACTN